MQLRLTNQKKCRFHAMSMTTILQCVHVYVYNSTFQLIILVVLTSSSVYCSTVYLRTSNDRLLLLRACSRARGYTFEALWHNVERSYCIMTVWCLAALEVEISDQSQWVIDGEWTWRGAARRGSAQRSGILDSVYLRRYVDVHTYSISDSDRVSTIPTSRDQRW